MGFHQLQKGMLVQMSTLRALLMGAAEKVEGADLRACLYRSWCHSAGAVLSLCLLSQVIQGVTPL